MKKIVVLIMIVLLAQDLTLAQQDPSTPQPTTAPAAVAPVARGRGGAGRGGRLGPQAPPGQGPTCPLDATIYEVRLAADQIGRVDLNALTRAAISAVEFENTLSALGTSKPLYRATQSVRLAGDSINIGSTMPYVTNSQTTRQGQAVNTVAYSNVGAVFTIVGKAGAGANIDMDMSIELSSLAECTTEVAAGIKAPMFRTATLTQKGIVEAQKPFVVLSIDAANSDAAGKAVAYIARVILGTPQGGQ